VDVLAELERGADDRDGALAGAFEEDREGALDEDLLDAGRFAEELPEVRLRGGALDRLAMSREYP
jgi:hypothetical protein